MLPKKITSLQHPLVKSWVNLRTSKAYRDETQSVLIVGEKMVRELKPAILIAAQPTNLTADEHFEVTLPIMKKITGLEAPDGFAGIVPKPQEQDLKEKKALVIFDQISDPGNLGTLVRTALALDWDGVILTPGTVDLFNDKATRAAKGANFKMPYAWIAPEKIELLLQNHEVFVADLHGDPMTHSQKPMALILSNESKGPRSWSQNFARRITIPMKEGVESLNVASAGAILLYCMRNK